MHRALRPPRPLRRRSRRSRSLAFRCSINCLSVISTGLMRYRWCLFRSSLVTRNSSPTWRIDIRERGIELMRGDQAPSLSTQPGGVFGDLKAHLHDVGAMPQLRLDVVAARVIVWQWRAVSDAPKVAKVSEHEASVCLSLERACRHCISSTRGSQTSARASSHHVWQVGFEGECRRGLRARCGDGVRLACQRWLR